jgi:hypothetical protein
LEEKFVSKQKTGREVDKFVKPTLGEIQLDYVLFWDKGGFIS